jgi:hypothetical protein
MSLLSKNKRRQLLIEGFQGGNDSISDENKLMEGKEVLQGEAKKKEE